MLSKLTRHTPETFKPIVWVLLAISCTLNVLSVKHYTRGPLLDDSGFSKSPVVRAWQFTEHRYRLC